MLMVERIEQGKITILRLSGEVDDEGANVLRKAVLDCIQDQRYSLVLNFSSVLFVSYMGVGALLDYLGRLRSFKGDIKLACLNLQSRRMLNLMGLSHVFECFEVESLAVQGYQQVAA